MVVQRKAKRLDKGVGRGKAFQIRVDGEPVEAFEGETIAAAILAAGKTTLRKTAGRNEPRGIFCGVGACFECRMVVNGTANVQVCQTEARPGDDVRTQVGFEKPEGSS